MYQTKFYFFLKIPNKQQKASSMAKSQAQLAKPFQPQTHPWVSDPS